jgi:hypothetical protein
MGKRALAVLIAALILSTVLPVHAAVTIEATADDSLFVTYSFENLDQAVYDQAVTQITAETIPQAIVNTLGQLDLKRVQYGFGPEPLVLSSETRTIKASFFLSGTDIITFTMDRTTMKRVYQVKTEWRKFQLSLTSNFTISFSDRLDTPVSDWQRPDATSLYFESKQTDAPDIFFYLNLPSSAQNVRVEAETVLFEMTPSLEDQVLNSPLLILAALAVALVLVLIYRKVR